MYSTYTVPSDSSRKGLLVSECALYFLIFTRFLPSPPPNLLLIEYNLSGKTCPKFCYIHKLALIFTICDLSDPFYRIFFDLFKGYFICFVFWLIENIFYFFLLDKQYLIVDEIRAAGSNLHRFKSQICHLLAVWFSYLYFLSLSFHIHKLRIKIVPVL